MTVETINRAGHLAAVFSSLKSLGMVDRGVCNDILKGVLHSNPALLGVWTVWEPDAFDGRDSEFAKMPGHDETGRFIPLWHRFGGEIHLEPNTDYDKPEAAWYVKPSRHGEEVVIDPYEYPVGGERLFITSQAAPIRHQGRCVGVAGFDVHMDSLLDPVENTEKPLESVLGRGHVLLGTGGEVRYCSHSTRALICRYVGSKRTSHNHLPGPLHELVLRKLEKSRLLSANGRWIFSNGPGRLVVRFTRHPRSGGCLLLIDEQQSVSTATRAGLSAREQEVCGWMGEGKSNEEIAIILGISAHTVKNHLDKVFKKLGVENRHAAARILQAA